MSRKKGADTSGQANHTVLQLVEQGASYLVDTGNKFAEQGTGYMIAHKAVMDSGADKFYVPDYMVSSMHNYKANSSNTAVKTAGNESTLSVKGKGKLGKWGSATHLEGLRVPLMSPGHLWTEKRYRTTFDGLCTITDEHGQVITKVERDKDGLYMIDLNLANHLSSGSSGNANNIASDRR